MKRASTLIFIIAGLGALGDLADLSNNGFDLNRHISFLYPLVFALFGVFFLILERVETNRLAKGTTDVPVAANDDVVIPDHAQMRAHTPDGLG